MPGGLRNVIGRVPGTGDGYVVVGAHYDTKDVPGFVGSERRRLRDGRCRAAGAQLKPRSLRRSVVFALFDGEESPRGTPDAQFAERGLRGSRVAAPSLRDARAMILLDFVGDRDLGIPREGLSDAGLWRRLRAAARAAGAESAFPAAVSERVGRTTTCRSSRRACPRST